MQRRWKKTLKLWFLSTKSFNFYLKQVCFLWFSDYVLFVSLFLTIQKLQFFCEPEPSPMSHFFWVLWFFARQKLSFFWVFSLYFCLLSSRTAKNLNFFCVYEPSTICVCILDLYLDHWVIIMEFPISNMYFICWMLFIYTFG